MLLKNRNANTHFNQNPVQLDMPRSTFGRSHSIKFDAHHGHLIPFYFDEVIPGDTVDITTSKIVRMMPMVTPVYDEIFLDCYFFFVPNRIIWDHFLEFMGEADEDTTVTPGQIVGSDLTIPQVTLPNSSPSSPESGTYSNWPIHSLGDYFGLPTEGMNVDSSLTYSALPFRAYQKIYNDWFRAEDFENPKPTYHASDADFVPTSLYQSPSHYFGFHNYPFFVNKTFDYFTSCLKAPQRGPDTSIAASGNDLPVYFGDINPLFNGSYSDYYKAGYNMPIINYGDDDKFNFYSVNRNLIVDASNGSSLGNSSASSITSGQDAYIVNAKAQLEGNFMTINQLRDAFAVQRYYEKLNRSGSRYISQIKAFYGVTSPDARLQRSEYLGGSRIYLDISQVTQTSGTTDVSPQGNLSGNSLTSDIHSDVHKSFTEHGLIIGVCCFRNNHTYQYGVERYWFKKTLFDFYNPTFANIGEQPVYNREIYISDDNSYNNSVFGYNEAWADYRYKPSRVCGLLRSSAETSLDIWHLADKYDEEVYLSQDWLQENDGALERIMSVTDTSEYLCDFYLNSKWTRVMPLYSVPGMLDHN